MDLEEYRRHANASMWISCLLVIPALIILCLTFWYGWIFVARYVGGGWAFVVAGIAAVLAGGAFIALLHGPATHRSRLALAAIFPDFDGDAVPLFLLNRIERGDEDHPIGEKGTRYALADAGDHVFLFAWNDGMKPLPEIMPSEFLNDGDLPWFAAKEEVVAVRLVQVPDAILAHLSKDDIPADARAIGNMMASALGSAGGPGKKKRYFGAFLEIDVLRAEGGAFERLNFAIPATASPNATIAEMGSDSAASLAIGKVIENAQGEASDFAVLLGDQLSGSDHASSVSDALEEIGTASEIWAALTAKDAKLSGKQARASGLIVAERVREMVNLPKITLASILD